ncbi:MAG: AAA family ATPase [Alphaproteobacteria bacterium]|nr:AAA family ATPase [Alphaproteobacteria bacterium]
MNTPTVPFPQKRRLQAHFGFTGMPFRKNVPAHKMFDSRAQRELVHALVLWLEVKGFALVTGPTGVGKSISLRRFSAQIDEQRFRVLRFDQVPSTPMGLLRSLCRLLGLPMRRHVADLFDQARDHLCAASANGPHPVILLDNAEGMRPDALDVIRRLTSADLDAEEHFSVLVTGTDELAHTLALPELASLRSRFGYAVTLRPFSLEDTGNYVRFHLQEAGAAPTLLSEDAVRAVFHASQGVPRQINQLVLQALIQATVQGIDQVDGRFMTNQIAAHPLYPRGEP